MSLLAVRDLSLTLGQSLFSDLSLTVSAGDRIGLIAANGRGKSRLLATLAGLEEPTGGTLTRARGLTSALVPQDVPAGLMPLPFREAVLAALPPDQAESEGWRADIVLDDLAVPTELRDRPLAQLSGGWQRSALLARAAVCEPDLYLLDEPTNHLDLSRIALLQRWLAGLPRDVAVIITSHDRAFLDKVTNRSLFLRQERSRLFPLAYSLARAELERADQADERRFDNEMARAEQLRRQAAKLKNIGINSGSDLLVTKTRQLSDRAARIESAARPAHRETSAGAIRLAHSGTHAKALVSLEDAVIRAPDGRELFRTGRLWIEPGDRIVLLGENGAGKTQLVNAIVAAIRAGQGGEAADGPTGGAIRATPSLVLGHSDQMLSQLPPEATPFALIQRFTPSDSLARGHLAGAGIRPDWQGRKVASLSGGQKARLAMLVLRLSAPNFHLLDEPTNHLDIEGQEALEAELTTPGASCLLVSHDRYFVRAVGTRFWQIQGRRLVEVDSPEAFFAQVAGRG